MTKVDHLSRLLSSNAPVSLHAACNMTVQSACKAQPNTSRIAPDQNGLFHTSDASPGDAILVIPRPWLTIVDSAHLQDTCSECFTWYSGSSLGANSAGAESEDGSSQALKSCLGCKIVRYCNKVRTTVYNHSIIHAVLFLSPAGFTLVTLHCTAPLNVVPEVVTLVSIRSAFFQPRKNSNDWCYYHRFGRLSC